MVTPESILTLSRRAVVAPAGHGKTELIAKAAALGRRTLVLTHTHAGVHAIRARLQRMHVPSDKVVVDTIASWARQYVQAFPGRSGRPALHPNKPNWDDVYLGAASILQSPVVQEVIKASYDRVLIDEYQDCEQYQHLIACWLSCIVPTVIFGDPMQGIFEFVDTKIGWNDSVATYFSQAYELQTPHRWASANMELGMWIAETRQKLMTGMPIDLRDGPINYIQSNNAFDMSLFFDEFNSRTGSTAAINCWRNTCNELAKSTRGAFQSIEEIAAKRLMDFAEVWDVSASNPQARADGLRSLIDDAITRTPAGPEHPSDAILDIEIYAAWAKLSINGSAEGALEVLKLERSHPLSRTFRGELIGDTRRALSEMADGRYQSLAAASEVVRQRLSRTGRAPVARTISTPLLLKGLEFDHVLIPDAMHYVKQKTAAAKAFYVAISRARHTLTISSKTPILEFALPNL
ncbi:UvrD-helicase domain-containing protein [Pseudomonas asplenii]|uniref:UvrD-helicase domain-containing protein n=1 Tax=Pseudomonas asplenii TaxID=53407 RepID=UPI00037DE149|nr:UvrD-helicase domain-containing protein [Pseudomonas fuscovaginae]